MLNKRNYVMLRKLGRGYVHVTDENLKKLGLDADGGPFTVHELLDNGYVKTDKEARLTGKGVHVSITPKGEAALADYRHLLSKERYNRLLNFVSGLVIGMVSGIAVTVFSFWMMVRFTQ